MPAPSQQHAPAAQLAQSRGGVPRLPRTGLQYLLRYGKAAVSWTYRPVHDEGTERPFPNGVLYLVVSGAPAPEGVPALVGRCHAAG